LKRSIPLSRWDTTTLASSWEIPAFTVTHSRSKSRKWLFASLSKSDDQKTGGRHDCHAAAR
jgi:hypothetical protein